MDKSEFIVWKTSEATQSLYRFIREEIGRIEDRMFTGRKEDLAEVNYLIGARESLKSILIHEPEIG